MPLAAFTAASLVGQTLDEKYLIEEQLGAGGMGTVFRALHLGTQRRVAIKIITPELMTTEEYLERFRREARAAGRLQHPNVVNVTDFGVTHRGETSLAYLTMEYLEGFALATLLRNNSRPSLSQAIEILEQVALAVDEAHRAGIVHRDLKPDNIWLRPDTRGGFSVKVLDFGVASVREFVPIETIRDVSADETVPLSAARTSVSGILRTLVKGDSASQLTRAGSIIGTPGYMSPEQCSGASVSTRSDIYSLGVIAFQLVTGHLPFSGDTLELIAKHIAGTPPDPRQIRHDLPAAVAATILSALEKDPSRRPRSATAFAGSLRAGSEGPTMVLRRALAVYCMHFGEFVRLSWTAIYPMFFGAAVLAMAFVLGELIFPGETLSNAGILGALAAGGCGGVVVGIVAACEIAASLALFGVANERLRVAPFETLQTRNIRAEVARRLGSANAMSQWAFWKAISRLTWKYVKFASSLKDWSHAELMVVCMTVEQVPEREAIAAAREKAKTLPSSRWVLIFTYLVLMFLPPAVSFLIAYGFLALVGYDPLIGRDGAAAIVACLALPFGVLLWLPVWATGYAILDHSAQQALGGGPAGW